MIPTEGTILLDGIVENEEMLIYAEEEMNRAGKFLPDILCLSDEDMDPKNIMWGNLPYFERIRREENVPYTACFVEYWSSKWGELVTKEKSIWK